MISAALLDLEAIRGLILDALTWGLALTAGIAIVSREGVFEIEISRDSAVAALDGLRQIHRIGESTQRLDLFRSDLRHLHSCRLLQLDHRDTRVRESPQRLADVLELDRLMADVVDHPEVVA